LRRFIQVVNTQNRYNENGTINAIPIIIYYSAGDKDLVDYNTSPILFEEEMKYLHDNNFQVLTMKDLAYDKNTNYLFIK
jgi:hypothetical protein